MRYLNSILNSLLFSFSYFINLRKIFLTILLGFTLTPLLLHAGATNCHDSNFDHTALLGTNSFDGTTNGSTSAVQDEDDYEQIIIPSDGNITITITKTGQDINFYVGSGCDLSDEYNNTSGTSSSHTTGLIDVSEDDILYLKIDSTDAKEYTISYTYSAPIIEVSIAPDAVTVPEGFSSVDLNISLSRGAINGDLNVTYTNSDDNSTNYFIIEQWYDEYTLTIDINTSDLNQGDEFDITLISAIDSSGADTGIITDDDTSTITIGAPMADLYIVKKGSQNTVKINTSFSYAIAVINLGSADASGITVTDTLPTALQGSGIIDLVTTNTDSVGWTCTQSPSDYSQVVCAFDNNISAGENKIITLHVNVPNDINIIGTIINNVSVSSDADYDIRNDDAIERTRLVAENYEEENEVLELCYTDTTEDTMNSTDFNKNCEKTGNFWSGNGCIATVDINATSTLTHDINITLTKMYAPEIVNGTCSIDISVGTCSGFQDIIIDESPSFTKGYKYNIASSYGNFTISDSDSYDGNPNNPADLDGIGIYATYTYEGIYHFGRLADCSGASEGGVEITSTADSIDTSIGASATLAGYYNNSTDTSFDGDPVDHLKYIQTMVAASQRNITAVYLDIETKETEAYDFEAVKNYSDFVVIPYLVDNGENGECSDNAESLYDSTGDELVINIPEGSYSGTTTMAVPLSVRKNARLQLIVVDPNLLSPEGQKCLAASSTTGNLEGIGQCGNSEIQYVDGFGIDAWDRCGINNGQPCLSSNGGYSGGGDPTYPGYNPLYDNALGCYMCTFNIRPDCSTDNFAIRPDKFDLGLSHPDAPNLLRAGKDYGVSLTAKDAADNIPNITNGYTNNGYTNTYTVIDHNFNDDLDSDEIKYFKDGTEDTAGLLHGISDLNRSATVYAVEGLSSFSTSEPSPADEIVQVSYNDVGLIDLIIYDHEWAEVDNDDTPEDCNSTTHTWICGDKNVTFIPHHFRFSVLNITNQAGPDSNFTYVADNRGMPSTLLPTRSPMAARVQTRIEALTEDDAITENFRADDSAYPYNDSTLYYENNVSVVFVVKVPETGTNKYLYPNANESNTTTTADPGLYNYIGFGRTGLDA
ncbi:MAG: hypothetical protein ABFS32_20375, partial [Bacteroidota bacterium]